MVIINIIKDGSSIVLSVAILGIMISFCASLIQTIRWRRREPTVRETEEVRQRRQENRDRVARLIGESSVPERNNTTFVENPSATSLGPVNYYANNRHGSLADNWFQFQYIKENGEWHIYILRMPSLHGRKSDAHSTHRYYSVSRDQHWICYDPEPRTLKDAETISRIWADRILEYIITGQTFEEQRW